MAEPGKQPELEIRVEHGEIILSFAYWPAWVTAIKRLRTRAFNGETRAWHVPVRLAPELLAALEAAGVPEAQLAPLHALAQDALALAAAGGARALSAYQRVLPQLAERYPLLFAHQREGIEFLLRPRAGRGAILADDMGLGKTRQAIVAAHESAPAGRILVVCPASVKLNWAREIGLALGAGQAIAVLGPKPVPLARWTIVNYDLLRRMQSELLAEQWDWLILDEAHYIKNRNAQRTLLVVGGESRGKGLPKGRVPALVERAERVMLLTGTPVTNRPLDLFALLKAIDHPLGDDLMPFALRYCAAYQNEFGWDLNGASHLDELHERLAEVVLRRTKDEVLDLPPKLRTYMPVEVDLKAYRKVWLDHVATLARRKRRMTRRMLLAEIAKLRQAAAIAKIPAAIAFIETLMAAGEKVVVFTGYHAVVNALLERFGTLAVKLTGREGIATREAAVTAFQENPEVRIFVGNLKAAGVGVSLTAATQVLFVDYALVPTDHLQAEDRPYRIGQRAAVTVTYLSALETIDEEIEQLLAQKLAIAGAILEGRASEAGSFVDDLLAIVERAAQADLPG